MLGRQPLVIDKIKMCVKTAIFSFEEKDKIFAENASQHDKLTFLYKSEEFRDT